MENDSVFDVSPVHYPEPDTYLGPCAFIDNDGVGILLPLLTTGLDHPYHVDQSISSFRYFWWIFVCIVFCIEIPLSKHCRLWSDGAKCGI